MFFCHFREIDREAGVTNRLGEDLLPSLLCAIAVIFHLTKCLERDKLLILGEADSL